MICGARTNDLFDKVLFGGFGLSFVAGFEFGAGFSVRFGGGAGVLLGEEGEQALLGLGGGVVGIVVAKHRGGNGPVLSDGCGLGIGDVGFQAKEDVRAGVGVSAVVAECRVDVIGRDKIIIIFIVHMSPFHNPEESFGPISLGERDGFIWSGSLLVNASQSEEHCSGEGHRGFFRVVGLVDEECGGSAGQGIRQSFEELDIDFAGSLGFGRDVNGVKFGGSHNGWGFGGVKGSGRARSGVGFVGVGDRSKGFGRGLGISAGNGFGSGSAVGAGATSGGSATFLGSFGGRGDIAAMLVFVQVHEVGVRVFNCFFICIFKFLIFINVFHLFFTEFVEEPGNKGGVDHFDTLNGAIRGVGVKAEVGVGAAGAGNRRGGARVGSLVGKKDLFFSMGHVFQFGGHSVMEARQSKRGAGCGVGENYFRVGGDGFKQGGCIRQVFLGNFPGNVHGGRNMHPLWPFVGKLGGEFLVGCCR